MSNQGDNIMPAGHKSRYTRKQKRQAEHIEESYEARGYSEKEAERRAWATVNKIHGGGERLDGAGESQEENHEAPQRGGKRSHVNRDASNRDEMESE
jgi:plasmid stabilization system protein ParE